MKRCPDCLRDYYDDSLQFCLDDGVRLVDGPKHESFGSGSRSHSDETTEIFRSAATRRATERSIAVLPFNNISADPENEYFCDGLAEEILNALSKIGGLKVAARTSAFSFRGKDEKVSRIANELGVDHVLEGGVRRSGNRLRITVQLTEAASGYHLWSERFDREMDDIFDIQDEITMSVVESLKLKLLGEEKAIVLKRHTDNPQAFENYLKGIYYRWKLESTEFQKCGEFFHRAVEIDPNFALAHFGLASYYGYGTAWALLPIPPEEGWKKAEAAIAKVAELDPTLPETLIVNAMKLVHYRKWDEAGRGIESAAAANPTFGEIHHLNSFYLLITGRFAESINEERYALTIDPISVTFRHFLGVSLHFAGRLDEAITEYRSALELDPGNSSVHEMLAAALMQSGNPDSAVRHFRAAYESRGEMNLVEVFDDVLAKSGLKEALAVLARQEINRMEAARASGIYVPAIGSARAYLAAGDIENALTWLEKAADERNVFPLLFRVDPTYGPIQEHPRFRALIDLVGIPNAEGGSR